MNEHDKQIVKDVLRLSTGNDDIIFIKLNDEWSKANMDEFRKAVKNVLDVSRVIFIGPELDVEIIPRKERHYGVWCKEVEHWAEFGNGAIINSSCLGVIRCEQKHILAESEIREFNDDGTPGEVV